MDRLNMPDSEVEKRAEARRSVARLKEAVKALLPMVQARVVDLPDDAQDLIAAGNYLVEIEGLLEKICRPVAGKAGQPTTPSA